MLIDRLMSGCQNLILNYFNHSSTSLMQQVIYSKIGCIKNILYSQSTYQRTGSYMNWPCMCKRSNSPTSYSRKTFLSPFEYFSSYSVDSNDTIKKKISKPKDNSSTDETRKKRKKEIKTYITLIKADGSIQVTTLDEAEKLASRRNFKLVKTINLDSKTGRAVYNMVSESQYLMEDDGWRGDTSTKKEAPIKSYKVVSISSNINENDLRTKVRSMKKWIEKQMEVRVVISGEKRSAENVYALIEKELGEDGRILQKRFKGNDIRFQIVGPQGSGKKS